MLGRLRKRQADDGGASNGADGKVDDDDESRRLLRNGKSLPTPTRSQSERHQAADVRLINSPDSPCCSSAVSASTSAAVEDTGSGHGSCAICWREFGAESSLEGTAVVQDSALAGRHTEDAHMFCATCIAEVCWQHHVSLHRALAEGAQAPTGPKCPKCRATFTHVLLHRDNDLGVDSAGVYGSLGPASSSLAASLSGAGSAGGPASGSMHTHEVSTRHLMCLIGPRRRRPADASARVISMRAAPDGSASRSSVLFAMLGTSL